MSERTLTRLIFAAVLLVIGFVTLIAAFDLVPIHGNQVGVRESWFDGVDQTPLPPRTYWAMPWQRITPYSTAVNVFVMNDKTPEQGETSVGRRQDSYLVQSKDSQDMHLSLQVQWRIDPAHVIPIHTTVGPDGIEERILRPTVLRIVKDKATTREAIEAYAGAGLVQLQSDIQTALNDPAGELHQRGLIVENFVIEHIRLDPEYVREITQRQIAMQRELRARQEEKAAVAEAARAKATAQAGYETAVVGARRDKEVQILQAQANKEQEILKADGERQKAVLAAQGEKESGELKAAAIVAIGRANAESEKLKFSAYSAPGSDTYARIEIARSLGISLSGIKGYLPHDMQVVTLGENFLKAVEAVAKGPK